MAHFCWNAVVDPSWRFADPAPDDPNYDREDVEWEMRRFSNDPSMANLSRLLTVYFLYTRSFSSYIFEMIWGGCKIMGQLRRRDNDEATVLQVFDQLLDLAEEAEDLFGFCVDDHFPIQFLVDVLSAATQILGEDRDGMFFKFWLLRIFFDQDPSSACQPFLALENSTDHLNNLSGQFSVHAPSYGPPHDVCYTTDLLRAIRYCFSLGILYAEVGSLHQALGCLERGLNLLRTTGEPDVAAAAGNIRSSVDFTLCWWRLSRALAGVYLRLRDPAQALSLLQEAMGRAVMPGWGLTEHIPASYNSFLGQVCHSNFDAPQEIDLSSCAIPARFLEDLALFVISWAEVPINWARGLLLLQSTNLFLVGRLKNLPEDSYIFGFSLLRQIRRVWLSRYNLARAAAVNSPDHFRAHLDYINGTRECRQLEVWQELAEDEDEDTSFPDHLMVLRSTVDILRIVHVNHVWWPYVITATNYLLGRYCIYQQDEEGQEVLLVAPQLYQLLEDVYFLQQDLLGFLANHMIARFATHHLDAGQLIDTAGRQERYTRIGHLFQVACRTLNTDASEQLSLCFTRADTLLKVAEQSVLACNMPVGANSTLMQLCLPTALVEITTQLRGLQMQNVDEQVSKDVWKTSACCC